VTSPKPPLETTRVLCSVTDLTNSVDREDLRDLETKVSTLVSILKFPLDGTQPKSLHPEVKAKKQTQTAFFRSTDNTSKTLNSRKTFSKRKPRLMQKIKRIRLELLRIMLPSKDKKSRDSKKMKSTKTSNCQKYSPRNHQN